MRFKQKPFKAPYLYSFCIPDAMRALKVKSSDRKALSRPAAVCVRSIALPSTDGQ